MLTLYVAEFLHTFQKPLDLPRLPLLELRQALTGDAEATSTALLRQTLFQLTTVRLCSPVTPCDPRHGVVYGLLRFPCTSWHPEACARRIFWYVLPPNALCCVAPCVPNAHSHAQDLTSEMLAQVIIEDLMENEKPSRQDKRWRAALGAGTWPEVLRRYILTRLVQADPPLASMEAAQGAYAISTLGFDGLPPRQKLSFLAAVCDEVLDTKTMRDELQDRADRVEQVPIFLQLLVACNTPFYVWYRPKLRYVKIY